MNESNCDIYTKKVLCQEYSSFAQYLFFTMSFIVMYICFSLVQRRYQLNLKHSPAPSLAPPYLHCRCR